MDTKWFFSLMSGEIYEVSSDCVYLLDNKQVPLLSKPSPNCNKCFGKLYTNYYVTGKRFDMCKKCAKKYVDTKFLNSKLTHELQTTN